jgi:hypothetical protein
VYASSWWTEEAATAYGILTPSGGATTAPVWNHLRAGKTELCTYVRLSQIQRLFANTRLTLLFYFHEALGKAAAERTSRTRLGFGATTT